jgi:hypothetical protein
LAYNNATAATAADRERAEAMPKSADPPKPADPVTMKFRGAYLEERGVHFAVVSVEKDIVQSERTQKEAARIYQRIFPEASIIFMVESDNHPPVYYGRKDIVAFLNTLEESQIKWKSYTVQMPPEPST